MRPYGWNGGRESSAGGTFCRHLAARGLSRRVGLPGFGGPEPYSPPCSADGSSRSDPRAWSMPPRRPCSWRRRWGRHMGAPTRWPHPCPLPSPPAPFWPNGAWEDGTGRPGAGFLRRLEVRNSPGSRGRLIESDGDPVGSGLRLALRTCGWGRVLSTRGSVRSTSLWMRDAWGGRAPSAWRGAGKSWGRARGRSPPGEGGSGRSQAMEGARARSGPLKDGSQGLSFAPEGS